MFVTETAELTKALKFLHETKVYRYDKVDSSRANCQT